MNGMLLFLIWQPKLLQELALAQLRKPDQKRRSGILFCLKVRMRILLSIYWSDIPCVLLAIYRKVIALKEWYKNKGLLFNFSFSYFQRWIRFPWGRVRADKAGKKTKSSSSSTARKRGGKIEELLPDMEISSPVMVISTTI